MALILQALPGPPNRGNVCLARALRAPGALLLDYVPPEEPPSTPLGNTLRIGDPNCPSSRKLQTGVHSTTLAPLRAILVNKQVGRMGG